MAKPPPTVRVQRGSGATVPAGAAGNRAAAARAATVTAPSSAGTQATGVVGRPAPQVAADARPKSYAAAAAAKVPVAGLGEAQSNAPQSGHQNPTQAQDVEMSAAQRFAEDEGIEPADEAQTIPEEQDDHRNAKELNARMLKIERLLERRRRALEKAESAVADQEDEIATQQAKLVELRAAEDEKREEIQALNEEKRVLSQRLARLNAGDGADQGLPGGPSAGMPNQDPLELAKEYLSQSFLGLQNFKDQPPQIQDLLLHFAKGIERLQAEERTGQTTLDQSFAAQRAAQASASAAASSEAEYPCLEAAIERKRERSPVGAQPNVGVANLPHAAQPTGHTTEQRAEATARGEASAEQFDISSQPSAPNASVRVEVAASTGGGYGRAPREHEPLCGQCQAVVCKCNVQSVCSSTSTSSKGAADVPMDSHETALVVWQPPKHRTRSQLLQDLEARNAEQATRARGSAPY